MRVSRLSSFLILEKASQVLECLKLPADSRMTLKCCTHHHVKLSFNVVLEINPRSLYILDKHSTLLTVSPAPKNTGSRDITSMVSISHHAYPEKLSPVFYPYKKTLIFCKISEAVRLCQPLHTLSSVYCREPSPSFSQIKNFALGSVTLRVFGNHFVRGLWISCLK